MQEISSNEMYKPKILKAKDVEVMLIKYLQECDAEELCATIDHVFGVQSNFNVETEEIVITPDVGYGEAFGVFEIASLSNEPCKCKKTFEPEVDKFVAINCKCGKSEKHWHCCRCSGIVDKAF